MFLPINSFDGYFTMNHNKYQDKHFKVTLDMEKFQKFIVNDNYKHVTCSSSDLLFNHTSLFILIFKLNDNNKNEKCAINSDNLNTLANCRIKQKIVDINYSLYTHVGNIVLTNNKITCLNESGWIPSFLDISIDNQNYSEIYSAYNKTYCTNDFIEKLPNKFENTIDNRLIGAKCSEEYLMFAINVGNYLWHLQNTASKQTDEGPALSCYGVPVTEEVRNYIKKYGSSIYMYNSYPNMFKVKGDLYNEIMSFKHDILNKFGFENYDKKLIIEPILLKEDSFK